MSQNTKKTSDIHDAMDVTKFHYTVTSMMEMLELNANVYGQ